ncbi:hypothetical protein ACEPAF_837 [Sanghuangporus sanghuang]
MSYFPFTFLFNIPGLSNPFSALTAPATSDTQTKTGIHSEGRSDAKSLKRNFDGLGSTAASDFPGPGLGGAVLPASLNRKRPPPSGPPPARLVRKRGWQPSSVQLSRATVVRPSTSGEFDPGAIELKNMSSGRDKGNDDEDVELELPPAKRRKGIAESVISTAFNAALVGAAVGLTVFRLWKDRGKEAEQTPPPPYQEEWANPTTRATPEPEEPNQPTPRKQRHHSSAHKQHGNSVRHRQKAARKTVLIRKDKELSPRHKSPQLQHEGHSSLAGETTSGDDVLDEMDWIGDRLAQLVEEGKRALGTEVIVASEAPEDEVDDGSGNWEEENPMEASASFSSSRPILSTSPSKRFRHQSSAYSLPDSSVPRLSSFPSHSRIHSDDLSASFQSTPGRSAAPASNPEAGSSSFLANSYGAESPSIRESMERARAAYLQRHGLGLGIDTEN